MDKSYINEVKHNTNTDIWSAGGVVLRNNSNGLEVLVCERYSEGLIALPKGKPNEGESEAQTALREVREETGAIVEIITLVKEIFYSFQSNGKTMNKKVTFYLMKSLGGNIQHHDNEFDKVYWEQIDSALKKLTFQGEKNVLEEAIELVKNSD